MLENIEAITNSLEYRSKKETANTSSKPGLYFKGATYRISPMVFTLSSRGFPQLTFQYKGEMHTVAVKRLVWILVNGQVPAGMMVQQQGNKSNYHIEQLRLIPYGTRTSSVP
jgi:hypothetical protein